jgi:endonuclease/exonuclease/phosphatase family metal-dependent hydrolase
MKSIILLICLTVLSFQASAQKKSPNTVTEDTQSDFTVPKTNSWLDRFEKRQTKMIQLLNLSEQQKHSLDTLNDRYVTQKVLLQEDKSLNIRARTAHLEVMRRERENKFRDLLTNTQLSKWNDLRKGQRKKTFRKK